MATPAALPSPSMNFDHPPGRFIGQPIPAEDAGERLRHGYVTGLVIKPRGTLLRCMSQQPTCDFPGTSAFGAVRKRLPCGEQLLRTVRIRYPDGTPSE